MEFCEVCSGEKSKCKHKNRPKNKVRRNGCGAFAVLCAAAPRAVEPVPVPGTAKLNVTAITSEAAATAYGYVHGPQYDVKLLPTASTMKELLATVLKGEYGAFAVLCAAAPRAVATRATAALLYFSDDPVWIRCDMCSSARAARGARLCVSD